MAADPVYQGIPIILLTAGSAVRLDTVPAAAVLPKPFVLEQLLQTVAAVLAPVGHGERLRRPRPRRGTGGTGTTAGL